MNLYVLADMFDVPDLRAAFVDDLTLECFKPNFEVCDNALISFMAENIPKSFPIHSLLAIAVSRVPYYNPRSEFHKSSRHTESELFLT